MLSILYEFDGEHKASTFWNLNSGKWKQPKQCNATQCNAT